MPIPDIVNYRFDPFTGTLSDVPITEEKHTIPNLAPFVFYLNEIPKNDSPSSVIIDGFLEVSQAPGPGEFQVDYDYKTGLIRFHAADRGRNVWVSYNGLGTSSVVDYFNRVAQRDPRDSFENDFWKMAEVIDHFNLTEPSIRLWQTPTGVHTMTPDEHYVTLVASSTGFVDIEHYLQSQKSFNPGYGCVLSFRAKFSVHSFASGTRENIGLGVPTTASWAKLFNFTWSPLSTPSAYLEWETTGAGAGWTGDYINIPDRTVWHELTAIYTPGQLNTYLDGTEVGSYAVTNVNTTLYEPLTVHNTTGDTIRHLDVDYVYFSVTPGIPR